MSRLEDIKEISFGIAPVSEYVISRAKGSAGEDFSVTLPSIDKSYPPGADITIKGVKGLVTTREYVVGPDGYRTVLTGISKVSDLIRKAPAKTLMFMSMTPNELEEFRIANKSGLGGVSYAKLDYIPLIRLCDEKTFGGGWNSNDVIHDLVARMGLQLVCNVRSYTVRQVQADTQSSFFDTIMSIIGFLKPTVFVDGGVLYILNKPYRSGSVSLDKISNLSQKESMNYSSKVTNVKVQGGQGIWDRSKYKGAVSAETQKTITTVVGTDTTGQTFHATSGDARMLEKMVGVEVSGGTITFKMKTPQGVTDETTTTETYRVDPFGNNKALLSRHTITISRLFEKYNQGPVKTYDGKEAYKYDFLDEQFDRPRVVEKVSSVGRYSWMLVVYGGAGSYRYFKQKVDNIVEQWIYAPNGNLLAETMTRMSDCFKAGSSYGDTIVELDLGDYYWTPEGQDPYDGFFIQEIVEERITRYRQITQDTYQKMTFHRMLGGLRRAPGDGRHTTTTEFAKGRVPKYPKSYRRMNVYAEVAPTGTVMNAPALVVGNPNIVLWSDAKDILNEVKRNAVDYNYNIERQVVVPKDIPVDIGWPVTFGLLPAGASESIPSVTVRDGIIAAWSKVKDAKSGTINTILTLEGKVG